MFSFTDLKSVHIEISNRCQAQCPMCSRNHHGGIENPLLKEADWTVNDFIQVFDKEVKSQIEKNREALTKKVEQVSDDSKTMINNEMNTKLEK